MSKSELIVGLDIGTTKICCVVGETSDDGTMNIVGVGESPSTGLRKGVVVNIEQTVQSIRKAVEEAERMANCEIRSVYAGIAGSHIKGTNSHGAIPLKDGKEVDARDIERVIEAAKAVAIPSGSEVIHILPQEYIVDDQLGISDPVGMSGYRLEAHVHIVTGAITSAQNIIRSCKRSNLEVSDIVLEALASSKAILTDEEREIGVAIVDLGGGTSDIAVFTNDSIKHTGSRGARRARTLPTISPSDCARPWPRRKRSRYATAVRWRTWCAQRKPSKFPAWEGRPSRYPFPPASGGNLRAAHGGNSDSCGSGAGTFGLQAANRRGGSSHGRHGSHSGLSGTGRAGVQSAHQTWLSAQNRSLQGQGQQSQVRHGHRPSFLRGGKGRRGAEFRDSNNETSVFNDIISRMKKWFVDIK